MKNNRIKRWISLTAAMILLVGGYVAYQSFLTGRSYHNRYLSPQGRTYIVERTVLPIGVNGKGTIIQVAGPTAVVAVRENDIPKLKIGQKVRVWVFEASSSFTGEVASISNKPRSIRGQNFYDVTIPLIDATNVTPGMTADAQIVLDSKVNVLMVPSQAVRTETDGTKYVWVLPPSNNQQPSTRTRPIRRNIQTGYSDERNAEIIYGLEAGEKVVVPTSQE